MVEVGRPRKYVKAKLTSVYFPEDLHRKIEEYAKKKGLSKNETIIILLSSADRSLSEFLIHKWKMVEDMISKHREELRQLKALLAPSEILKHVSVDERIEKYFKEFCEKKRIKVEKVRDVYRYVQKFLLNSFCMYLESKGYVVKNREMLRAYLTYRLSQMKEEIERGDKR